VVGQFSDDDDIDLLGTKGGITPEAEELLDLIRIPPPTQGFSFVLDMTPGYSQYVNLDIPAHGTNHYTVYWGDGTSDAYTTTSTLYHYYDTPQEYTITIEGAVNYISFQGEQRLVRVLSPLPEFSTSTSMDHLFESCTNLTSVPENLLANNPSMINFSSTFENCTSLQSIPADLFLNNQDATNFWATFANCTSLQGIPADLFTNNTNAVDFGLTFDDCTSIQGIPADLFDSNPSAYDFHGTFGGCTSLQSIPVTLFNNNTNVTSFDYAFNGCTGIGTNLPEWWNTTLWPTSTYPQFGSQSSKFNMFDGCTNTQNYGIVPSGWK